MPGGRGRGGKRGRPPTVNPANKVKCLSFPVTERDEENVTCSLCAQSSTFREFRLHNISTHYNLGTTTDDTTIMDHKFYEKKLKEMSKLMKITTFKCPSSTCVSKYKSALGLAYHFETCGKTPEEIEACLTECDICHGKYSVPNMQWHRKHHHPPPPPVCTVGGNSDRASKPDFEIRVRSDKSKSDKLGGLGFENQVYWFYHYFHQQVFEVEEQEPELASAKRKSAIKAREFMKEITDFTASTASDNIGQRPSCQLDPDSVDKDFQPSAHLVKQEIEDDEEEVQNEEWECEPSIDCLLGIDEIKTEEVESNRRTMTSGSRVDFSTQAVRYLETHSVDTENAWDSPERNFNDPFPIERLPNENPVHGFDSDDEVRAYIPFMEISVEFQTKVQTKPPFSPTSPRTLTTVDYHRLHMFESEVIDSTDFNQVLFTGGPVLSMAWHPSGNFLAVSTLKDYNEEPIAEITGSGPTSVLIYSKTSDERSNSEPAFDLELVLALDHGYINHLQWGSYWPVSCEAQINARDESISDAQHRIGYLAAACEDSTVRIIAVRKEYFALPPNFSPRAESGLKIRVYRKVPEVALCFHEHSKQPTGQCSRFDWHERSKYLVAGYVSGLLAVYDTQATSRLLSTYTVYEDDVAALTFYPIWIINSHLASVTGITIDPTDPRYFYTGSLDRTLKTWDIELRNEIETKKVGCMLDSCFVRGWIHMAVSVDVAVSNPGAQYNFVRFYQLGSSKGIPNQVEYFNVTSLSFFEGMTLSGTENGRTSATYFDSFWRECDYDRNKKKKNVVNISHIVLDERTFVRTPHVNKAIDAKPFPEGDPKIILVVSKERAHPTAQADPEPEDVENFIRFNKFLRVNKVAWSPKGEYIAVGYRNGLLTILPATYDKLYSPTPTCSSLLKST